jgi:hypothetical protein
MTAYFEFRFYTCGWRIGLGPFYARYQNSKPTYSEFCIGRIRSDAFGATGGMTFKDWKLARKQQQKEAAAIKRASPLGSEE